MSQLNVISRNGKLLVDSREVAGMVDKPHDQLMRSIRTYVQYLTSAKMQTSEFFNESTYTDSKGEVRPCYLITKKGCDMVANKMTGEKGILFTAEYVTRFDEMEKQISNPAPEFNTLSPQLQFMIQMEQRQNQLEAENREVKEAVSTLTNQMTAVPDQKKVVDTVNEYARWTRLGHNEVYNKVYDIMQAQHGIDVPLRVANERERIQNDYHEKTGRWYAESTLKKRVNGIDIMVRMGCLDKFYSILSGLLAKEKVKSKLSVVK